MPDLLAAVYPQSGALWTALRERCCDVSSWLQHLDYESEIERDATFNSSTALIQSWPSAEMHLQQARNLLGRRVWDGLAARAAARVTNDQTG